MLSEKVRDVIVETLGCEAEAVTPEASLEEDLGADSLAFVELVSPWRMPPASISRKKRPASSRRWPTCWPI